MAYQLRQNRHSRSPFWSTMGKLMPIDDPMAAARSMVPMGMASGPAFTPMVSRILNVAKQLGLKTSTFPPTIATIALREKGKPLTIHLVNELGKWAPKLEFQGELGGKLASYAGAATKGLRPNEVIKIMRLLARKAG